MMDKGSDYLRNVALMMPVCICLAWPLKYILSNRAAGIVACALLAVMLAVGWLPVLSRWITAHWRIVLATSILAYMVGFAKVAVFLWRAFCL